MSARPSLCLLFLLSLSAFDMRIEDPKPEDLPDGSVGPCLRECLPKCPSSLVEGDLGVSCFSSCLAACAPVVEVAAQRKAFKAKLAALPKNFCTFGVNPAERSPKEILKLFAEGPCMPAIMAPGVMATRMTLNIDCKLFAEKEPKTFERCGWNACEKGRFEFWKKVPKAEYRLWIPDLLSDLSIISFSEQSNNCFAALMKPHFNPEKPIEKMAKPRDGLTIRVFGFSDGSKAYSVCGASAIENLLPLPVQTTNSMGFAELTKAMIRVGYVPGLTMQAIPYNFYYSYRFNEFTMAFRFNLARLNHYTGKKVVVIGHSMGNINILSNLNKMSAKDKQRLIHVWVSIGAPFMGSPKGQKMMVAGTDEFLTFKGYLGWKFTPQVLTLTSMLSAYELCAVNPFSSASPDDPFLAALHSRMRYENYFPNVEFKDSGFSFWPAMTEECYDSYVTIMPTVCAMKLPDLNVTPMIRIGGQSFGIHDTLEMVRKHQLSPLSEVFIRKVYGNDLSLSFPEVPAIVIFTNAVRTPFYHEFGDNFDDEIRRGVFPTPKKVGAVFGDKTVPAYSTLIPALRWAFYFDNPALLPKVSHKPVKFIEFCSRSRRNTPIYDDMDYKQPWEVKRNSYAGLECACNDRQRGDDYESCEHAGMHGDPSLIEYLLKVLVANHHASEDALKEIDALHDEDLVANLRECAFIRSGIFI